MREKQNGNPLLGQLSVKLSWRQKIPFALIETASNPLKLNVANIHGCCISYDHGELPNLC